MEKWMTDSELYNYLNNFNIPFDSNKSWFRIGDSFMLDSFYQCGKAIESKQKIISKCFEKDSIHTLKKYVLPINILNEHWILFVIDVKSQFIYTFNSYGRFMFSTRQDRKICLKYDEMERIQLYKMKSFLFWYGKMNGIEDFHTKPWITIYSDYKILQNDDWSCGFYVLFNIVWQSITQDFSNRLHFKNFALEYECITNGRNNTIPFENRISESNHYTIIDIKCNNQYGPFFCFCYFSDRLYMDNTSILSKDFEELLDQQTITELSKIKYTLYTNSPFFCNLAINTICEMVLKNTFIRSGSCFVIENDGLLNLNHSFALLFFCLFQRLESNIHMNIELHIVDRRIRYLSKESTYCHPFDMTRETIQGHNQDSLSFIDEMYDLGRLFFKCTSLKVYLHSTKNELKNWIINNNRTVEIYITMGHLEYEKIESHCKTFIYCDFQEESKVEFRIYSISKQFVIQIKKILKKNGLLCDIYEYDEANLYSLEWKLNLDIESIFLIPEIQCRKK
jgi:hypothetical protein